MKYNVTNPSFMIIKLEEKFTHLFLKYETN